MESKTPRGGAAQHSVILTAFGAGMRATNPLQSSLLAGHPVALAVG